MADRFGSLSLPTVTSETPLGDPSLGHLAAFCKAVINAECALAWAAARPRTGDLALPCRSAYTHNPHECDFDEKSLPAVFVFREKGVQQNASDDYLVDIAQVSIMWVYPPADHQAHQSLRAPFHNAVKSALMVALDRGVHTAWAKVGETNPLATSLDADPDAICLAQATSLAPATLARTGAIGSSTMSPLRGLTVTTSATVAAAYNTTDPIVITCEDWLGGTLTFEAQPTQANGGETIEVEWDVRKVSANPAVPAQLSTAGTISVGVLAFEGQGSSLSAALGLLRPLMVSEAAPSKLRVSVLGTDGRETEAVLYDALKLTVQLHEQFVADPTLHAQTPWGTDIKVLVDDFVASDASLPDAAE